MSTVDEQAGEYVLGLLEGPERAAFEAAMAVDGGLASRVRAFASRMRDLDDTAQGGAILPGLWSRIEAKIPPRQTTAQASSVRSAGIPRWAAMAASVVVAAGLGFAAGQSVRGPEPAPVVVAVLISDTNVAGAIVEAFANNSIHIIPLEGIEVPEGKILEVWTKPNEEIGPVSLGRFLRPMEIVFPANSLPVPAGGQLYEITLENAPGSPTGKPTGPILFKGLAQTPV